MFNSIVLGELRDENRPKTLQQQKRKERKATAKAIKVSLTANVNVQL
jgi:hypothetical protein